MIRKVLYSAIAAVAGTFGCTGASVMAAPHCTAVECTVVVKIKDCAAEGGISVVPDPLTVTEPRKIVWVIKTAGYSFANNGIEIGPDPDGELETLQVDPNGKKVTVRNKHNKKAYGIYYAVNVVKANGTACRRLDPWIHNQ